MLAWDGEERKQDHAREKGENWRCIRQLLSVKGTGDKRTALGN